MIENLINFNPEKLDRMEDLNRLIALNCLYLHIRVRGEFLHFAS
ncbi:MAG: hypothetical protein ABIG95_03300 [Candidatus Woesearchaeota archaeon]